MRVHSCITMTRKMFEAGDNSGCPITFDHCYTKTSDQLWVFTKRAYTNDGIGGIIVHINNWSQVHVNAKCFKLTPRCQSNVVSYSFGANSTQCHIARKDGCAPSETTHHSVLLVDHDQQRITMSRLPGNYLQAMCEFTHLPHIV